MNLSVIIPVYRESPEHLLPLVGRVRAAVPAARLIIVDDGNAESEWLTPLADIVVRHEQNRGYVHAIRSGLTKALADPNCTAVIKLDADGQYFPERIPMMVRKHLDGFEVVSASRYLGAPVHTGYPEREAVNRIISRELADRGIVSTDPFTGFRLFSRRAVERLLDGMGDHVCKYGYGLSLETTLRIHLLNLRATEVPCELHYPTLKQFPGDMADPKWRLRYYRQMIEGMLAKTNQKVGVCGNRSGFLQAS
jgi:glycosyltransferase involved in cell wall biosynthesis